MKKHQNLSRYIIAFVALAMIALFVRCQDEKNCSIYYHERGVGRTLSSSTGSAAVYAVLQNQGQIGDHLLIQTPAGTIMVSGKDKIYIENSTKIMYKGKWLQ